MRKALAVSYVLLSGVLALSASNAMSAWYAEQDLESCKKIARAVDPYDTPGSDWPCSEVEIRNGQCNTRLSVYERALGYLGSVINLRGNGDEPC